MVAPPLTFTHIIPQNDTSGGTAGQHPTLPTGGGFTPTQAQGPSFALHIIDNSTRFLPIIFEALI